ncbi:unnamed protein product [Ceratitis capitata]|uniref:(Mediterranean fruit fly) hypothetical protein n=1 Tax=Ceratitis capitata TaxID=7213 RepID=A0A811V4M5_CERCA|nr:unnamed protein product [Ceratitis capitata]
MTFVVYVAHFFAPPERKTKKFFENSTSNMPVSEMAALNILQWTSSSSIFTEST